MPKTPITYKDFFDTVPAEHKKYVDDLHKYLLTQNYKIAIKEAKNGYVVSYIGTDKKTLFNYIFRKSGMQMRIYANHIHFYPAVLETLPATMIACIEKASVCRRMLDPAKCNSRCSMGYDFTINGTRYQKCRNSAFLFPLSTEHNPFLRNLLEKEINVPV